MLIRVARHRLILLRYRNLSTSAPGPSNPGIAFNDLTVATIRETFKGVNLDCHNEEYIVREQGQRRDGFLILKTLA